ncbi:MAG: hypothetical protein KAS36_02315 [Anaerolineales bacterium]|nr:hypothetical protein [Anaerolineales bacterium]
MSHDSQLGNPVEDPQGDELSFDVTSPCVSGVGEHYTATRELDPPLYYIVGSGEVAPGTMWKLYCWKFCPYSLEWRAHHHTTDNETGVEVEVDGFYTTTDLSTGERIQYQVTSDKQTTHAGTVGRMAYHQRGRRAGFICVDPDCYYYATYTSGTQYFFQV